MSVLIKGMEMPESCWECPFEKCVLRTLVDRHPDCPLVEVMRCKDCRWGREVCGNIECFVDSNVPAEYHGYEWFCPNGERREVNEREHTN